MKFIAPTVEILQQASGLVGVKKMIEIAGRTAYKSEDKITDTSCEAFVEMLSKRKHGAALEHGTVYLYIHDIVDTSYWDWYKTNKYSCYYQETLPGIGDGIYHYDVYITTNYRVLVENNRMGDLPYISDYVADKHTKRISVKFILSRGIANEFVRHRHFSFLQESTRFCNYGKKGGEVSFILPGFARKHNSDVKPDVTYFRGYKHRDVILYQNRAGEVSSVQEGTPEYAYLDSLLSAEEVYLFLTQKVSMQPQFARGVLPLDLKTELVMTGTIPQWTEFFKLRCAQDAHPDARYLADMLKDLMFEHGWYKDEDDLGL